MSVYTTRSEHLEVHIGDVKCSVRVHHHKQPFAWLENSGIPSLPVPTLQATCDRYLKAVAPLLSADEKKYTESVIGEFLRDENQESSSLQRELVDLVAQENDSKSYVEGFWDTMYLEIRGQLPVHVNPFLMLREDEHACTRSRRAARLTACALRFYVKVLTEELPQDYERRTPLCMTQYGRLFATARVPRARRDLLLSFSGTRHIVVLHRDRLYALLVLDDQHRPLYSEQQLEVVFRDLGEYAERLPSVPSISALTGDERDRWASVRVALQKHSEQNADSLAVIDSAIFLVCLEDTVPSTITEAGSLMMHNRNGQNRWFDKSVQFVIFPDGCAGINMEHTPIDGHTLLILMTHCYEESIALGKFGSQTTSETHPTSVHRPPITELRFDLSPELMHSIETAQAALRLLITQVDLEFLHFTSFGKNGIVKHKMSPDGFVQMCFQLAHYRLTGTVVSTYESANTKQFRHGRTETVRSVSDDSVRLCAEWKHSSSARRSQLLRTAVQSHAALMRQCKDGMGVDRHLYVLGWLARQREQRRAGYRMPRLFEDPALQRLTASRLSTSNCGGRAIASFGFGAVVPDGLGIGYVIEPNELRITVSSFTSMAASFCQQLRIVLDEVMHSLDTARHTHTTQISAKL
eukprot:CAMPEP_0177648390 /NCGR_PEP_ID=MMETSP0447-20121125/10801_1 /TAXON_ID=0 /ORGANISM="Stygamoeba regulata, Strain BSH-02190019" /LENGTH=635 /DNA_ID=CAMNT_0019151025 /DNA_START=8 /DNA_END=1915 /DNA_ORIENTATION=-